MKRFLKTTFIALALCVSGVSAQTISAFGDSQTEATYYSNSALRWRSILAASLGQTVTSHASGGHQTGDQLPAVIAKATPGANDKSLFFLGTNHQKLGVNSTLQGYFIDSLRALILQRALAVKQPAATHGTEAGSWTSVGLVFPSFGKASTATGSTKTFTLSGTTVYLSILVIDTAGDTGTYEVRIDGGSWQSFNAVAAGITSPNGYPYNERAHRFAGLSSGSHTIEVKQTGGTKLYVQWAGGNDQSIKPPVYVGNLVRMSAAGYATFGSSTANVQSYNTDLAAMVAELVADGLNVTLVDLYNALNDTTDLTMVGNCSGSCQPDGLHISDSGQAKVAAAFLTAMGGSPPPPVVTYHQLYKGSDGVYYLDNSGVKTPTTVP